MRRRLAAAAAVALVVGAAGAASAAPPAEPTLLRPAARQDGRTGIVRFEITPFPYLGLLPDGSGPFLDVHDGARLGHTSPRGGVYWADTTYGSRDVLISIPPGFDPKKPITLLVFFHGNNATLERDVWHRQQVVAQLAQSRLNAVLVAPQFAVDALDSSAGNFWTAGIFSEFLGEAATRVAAFAGTPELADRLAVAPVLIAAYSGGYNPAAFALDIGSARERVCGVILLDALFGETPRFQWWITHRGSAFFVSAYSASSEPQNRALETMLRARAVETGTLPAGTGAIEPGSVLFVPATAATHNDFVTAAWTTSPLRALLARVKTCRAGAGGAPRPGTAEFFQAPGPHDRPEPSPGAAPQPDGTPRL